MLLHSLFSNHSPYTFSGQLELKNHFLKNSFYFIFHSDGVTIIYRNKQQVVSEFSITIILVFIEDGYSYVRPTIEQPVDENN